VKRKAHLDARLPFASPCGRDFSTGASATQQICLADPGALITRLQPQQALMGSEERFTPKGWPYERSICR
jgi:hypothetical protein